MNLKPKYTIGQMVTIKHDPDRLKRMIIGMTIWYGGVIRYCTQAGKEEMWCYEFEIDEHAHNKKSKIGFR